MICSRSFLRTKTVKEKVLPFKKKKKPYGHVFTLLGRKFTLKHFPIILLENKEREGQDQGRKQKSAHLIYTAHHSDYSPLAPATTMAFLAFCLFYNNA